jgi:hypothetical protein
MFTPDVDPIIERLWGRLDAAADTLERQAAEIKRLREALTDLLADECDGDPIARARAALTGEES